MSKKALVILAEGFEEIEAVTPIDTLRRAGIEVTVAGLSSKIVSSVRRVKIEADVLLDQYQGLPDMLILPGGGPGAKNLGASKKVIELVQKMNAQKKIIAAICAAPAYVLAPAGVLEGKRATCYPGCEEKFSTAVKFSEDRVVVDGNIITSQGPGSALEFALTLVGALVGNEKAIFLKNEMLARD